WISIVNNKIFSPKPSLPVKGLVVGGGSSPTGWCGDHGVFGAFIDVDSWASVTGVFWRRRFQLHRGWGVRGRGCVRLFRGAGGGLFVLCSGAGEVFDWCTS